MPIRSDLYRILHVQPDAPAPIIKASYRTIMQTLRRHPDLGGDAEAAQLLNEAVAILCNPARREQYDRERDGLKVREAAASTTEMSAVQLHDLRPDESSASISCLFCNAPAPLADCPQLQVYGDEDLCTRCGGARKPATAQIHKSMTDTRNEHRTAFSAIATLWQQWPLSNPLGVRIVDLSAQGAALICSGRPAAEGTVLLKSSMVNAIARVQYCVPSQGVDHHRVGLALSTLRMTSPPGAFVGITA